jgi:hypothetical protein
VSKTQRGEVIPSKLPGIDRKVLVPSISDTQKTKIRT